MSAIRCLRIAILGALVTACSSDSSVAPVTRQPVDLNQALSEMTLPSLAGVTTALPGVPSQALTTPLPSSCTYVAATSRFVCPTVTVTGLTITQSYTLLDASGTPQSAFDPEYDGLDTHDEYCRWNALRRRHHPDDRRVAGPDAERVAHRRTHAQRHDHGEDGRHDDGRLDGHATREQCDAEYQESGGAPVVGWREGLPNVGNDYVGCDGDGEQHGVDIDARGDHLQWNEQGPGRRDDWHRDATLHAGSRDIRGGVRLAASTRHRTLSMTRNEPDEKCVTTPLASRRKPTRFSPSLLLK